MVLCGAPSVEDEPAPPTASAAASVQAAVVPPRSGPELQQAVRDALRRFARTSDQEADAAAHELIVLYKELEQDRLLGTAPRQELRTKVRNRLAQLALQISKRQAREARQDKNRPQSVRLDKSGTVLGQWGGGAGQPGMGGGMGGAGGVGNNANATPDNGEDLVSLIQTTIAPKSWDANGGAGTIYYWKSQHALVVRNTQEVHQDISDVLEQLNRASH
jgi:hypothetical protein